MRLMGHPQITAAKAGMHIWEIFSAMRSLQLMAPMQTSGRQQQDRRGTWKQEMVMATEI
jgi:hypothetical protein